MFEPWPEQNSCGVAAGRPHVLVADERPVAGARRERRVLEHPLGEELQARRVAQRPERRLRGSSRSASQNSGSDRSIVVERHGRSAQCHAAIVRPMRRVRLLVGRLERVRRPGRPIRRGTLMPEAVIVATARSPIGRAGKGSLVSIRPDDLSTQIVNALLDKVPAAADATRSRTSSWAAASRPARPGFNIARVVAVLAGLDDVPGVTVNRYCSSSLQTIRMAAHAIKAGEGDCFIAAGVETVSRYGAGASDTAPNAVFSRRRRAHGRARARRQPRWTPPTGLPDIYIAMGQTAENVVRVRARHPRGDGRVRQAVPGPRRRQRRERLLRRRDHAGHAARRHRRVDGRRPARRHDARGSGPAQAGVPARRHGHRRQRLPAQRRRRRRARDERHQGRRARPHAARPRRVVGRHRAEPGDHGPRPDRGQPPGARPGRHDDRRHRPRRDQRGVRRPGHPVGQAPRHRLGEAQRARRRRSPSATRSA